MRPERSSELPIPGASPRTTAQNSVSWGFNPVKSCYQLCALLHTSRHVDEPLSELQLICPEEGSNTPIYSDA